MKLAGGEKEDVVESAAQALGVDYEESSSDSDDEAYLSITDITGIPDHIKKKKEKKKVETYEVKSIDTEDDDDMMNEYLTQ